MDAEELRRLARSGSPKLIGYALRQWEEVCPGDPEPLLDALRTGIPEVLKLALPLAVRHHPGPAARGVLDLLAHADPMVRRTVVPWLDPALGEGARRALQGLLSKEEHPHVLASAVLAAVRFRLPAALVTPFLHHQDARLRANTAKALAGAGGNVRHLLEPLLRDPSLRVQNEAIRGLARLVKEGDLEALIVRRLASPQAEVRAGTAFLAGELPLARRTALLLEVLQDVDEGVVRCAARSLARIGEPAGWKGLVEAYLQAGSEAVAGALGESLAGLPAARLTTLADRGLTPGAAEPRVAGRMLGLAAAREDWEPLLPWVLGGLQRPEAELRRRAWRVVLERLPFFQAKLEELLAERRSTGDPGERAVMAQIRWRAGFPEGLETLRRMLREESGAARRAAAEALRGEGNLLARGALEEARREGIAEAYADGGRGGDWPEEGFPEHSPRAPGGEGLRLPEEDPSPRSGPPGSPRVPRRMKEKG